MLQDLQRSQRKQWNYNNDEHIEYTDVHIYFCTYLSISQTNWNESRHYKISHLVEISHRKLQQNPSWTTPWWTTTRFYDRFSSDYAV